MDLRQLTMLVLQASIIGTILTFGMSTTIRDLKELLDRPGLFVRAILSVYILMPLAAVVLVKAGNFRPDVEVVLVALALSPVPPLLPSRESQAGGHLTFGVALMTFLALCAIVMVPLGLLILERVFDRPLSIQTGTIARIVLTTVLLPVTAGIAIRALLPGFAKRILKPLRILATVALALAALAVVVGALPAVLAVFGQGSALAVVIFTIAGLAIGHIMGGPNPDEAAVVALSTACRHPGIALTVAAANNPGEQFGPIVLFYLVIGAVVGIPYLLWSRRSTAALAAHRTRSA